MVMTVIVQMILVIACNAKKETTVESGESSDSSDGDNDGYCSSDSSDSDDNDL